MNISCVTPFLNAARWLPDQLAALAAQTWRGPVEFVFADNGSTDDSRAVITAWIPRLPGPVLIVDASDRRGAAHALNVGVTRASGDYLAFCDADDRVHPGWLDALARAALASGADFIEGACRRWDGSPGPCAAAAWTASDAVHLGFLPMFLNGNLLARASAVRALGGWAEDFRTGEDAEFSWRARLAGYRVASAPDALLDYRDRSTLASLWRQRFRFGMDDIRLLKRFSAHPRPRRTLADAWGDLRPAYHAGLHLLRRTGDPRAHRHVIVLRLAKKTGHLAGSLYHGYWFL